LGNAKLIAVTIASIAIIDAVVTIVVALGRISIFRLRRGRVHFDADLWLLSLSLLFLLLPAAVLIGVALIMFGRHALGWRAYALQALCGGLVSARSCCGWTTPTLTSRLQGINRSILALALSSASSMGCRITACKSNFDKAPRSTKFVGSRA
jgi:hypothetical protein